MRRLLLAALVALAAGCTVPHVADVGTVTIAPIPKTAPESPLISQACRAVLPASVSNAADVALGYWATQPNSQHEVANVLAPLHVAAPEVCP